MEPDLVCSGRFFWGVEGGGAHANQSFIHGTPRHSIRQQHGYVTLQYSRKTTYLSIMAQKKSDTSPPSCSTDNLSTGREAAVYMVYTNLQLVHFIIFHKPRAINTYVTAHNTYNRDMYPWRVDAVKLYLAATWFRLIAGTRLQKSILATHCLHSGKFIQGQQSCPQWSSPIKMPCQPVKIHSSHLSRHRPCVFSNNPLLVFY